MNYRMFIVSNQEEGKSISKQRVIVLHVCPTAAADIRPWSHLTLFIYLDNLLLKYKFAS